MEVTNFILSIVMIIVGISVIFRLEGKLKRAWGFLLATIALFGVHEIVGMLEEFGFGELEFVYIVTEVAYVIMFLICVLAFKSLFDKLSKSKK